MHCSGDSKVQITCKPNQFKYGYLILIALVPLRHFRKPFHVPFELSTVGLGTYIGAPDDQTDFDVYNAVKLMIMSGGVNVIDTAINYRC